MTRLWTLSDLHQEWPENAYDVLARAPADGFDVIVVAGDVHSPLEKAIHWLGERLPGTQLVYVPGNHDFYWNDDIHDRYSVADQMARGMDAAEKYGFHLLMDRAVVLDGTRFSGSTLWTDFRLGSRGWAHAAGTASGRDGMNDYRYIRLGSNGKSRIRPSDVRDMHKASVAFLRETLSTPHDGADVVVTHHAPHPDSLLSPHDDLRWCYASDLTELIGELSPDLWVHGHIHRHSDYQVGATRVLANPRGHKKEWNTFVDALVVEVGPGPAPTP